MCVCVCVCAVDVSGKQFRVNRDGAEPDIQLWTFRHQLLKDTTFGWLRTTNGAGTVPQATTAQPRCVILWRSLTHWRSARNIRIAGVSFGPPSIYDFNFSPVNCTLKTVFLLQKQYVMYTETPPMITKIP